MAILAWSSWSGKFLSCSVLTWKLELLHSIKERICIYLLSFTCLCTFHHHLSFQKTPNWLTNPTAAFQAWSCRGYKFNWDNNSCTSLASTANHLSLSDRCLPQSCEPIPTSELLRCTKPLLHFLVCVTINLVKLSTVCKSGSCFRVLSKLALALVMTGWTWWMIVIYFNMFLFWKIDLKLWIRSLEAGFSPDAVFPPHWASWKMGSNPVGPWNWQPYTVLPTNTSIWQIKQAGLHSLYTSFAMFSTNVSSSQRLWVFGAFHGIWQKWKIEKKY